MSTIHVSSKKCVQSEKSKYLEGKNQACLRARDFESWRQSSPRAVNDLKNNI